MVCPALIEVTPSRSSSAVCAVCKEPVAERWTCPGCGTLVHEECQVDFGLRRCPTLGCCDRPRRERRRLRAGLVSTLYAGLVASALIAVLAPRVSSGAPAAIELAPPRQPMVEPEVWPPAAPSSLRDVHPGQEYVFEERTVIDGTEVERRFAYHRILRVDGPRVDYRDWGTNATGSFTADPVPAGAECEWVTVAGGERAPYVLVEESPTARHWRPLQEGRFGFPALVRRVEFCTGGGGLCAWGSREHYHWTELVEVRQWVASELPPIEPRRTPLATQPERLPLPATNVEATAGAARTPMLGIERAGAEHGQGVTIARVVTGYGAERAGLRPGDVVKSVDGVPVDCLCTLRKLLDGYQAGSIARVTVVRGEETLERDVFLFAGP